MASYNSNILAQQIQDLSRQYQQLLGNTSSPPMQQNFIPQAIQTPTYTHQIQYVDGFDGALIYQNNMHSNCSEVIMDKNEDRFFVVSKDANGTPSKNVISAHFTIDESQSEESIYLTKKDFDTFKEEIKQLLSEQKNQRPAKAAKETENK